MELAIRRSHGDQVVECVDNDETAAVMQTSCTRKSWC